MSSKTRVEILEQVEEDIRKNILDEIRSNLLKDVVWIREGSDWRRGYDTRQWEVLKVLDEMGT